jgi:hypothetical protein
MSTNLQQLLRDELTVSIPDAGRILGFGRDTSFAAARAGKIKTIRLGNKMRVPTAWLRRQLELEPTP